MLRERHLRSVRLLILHRLELTRRRQPYNSLIKRHNELMATLRGTTVDTVPDKEAKIAIEASEEAIKLYSIVYAAAVNAEAKPVPRFAYGVEQSLQPFSTW